jgi:hypothetical protein
LLCALTGLAPGLALPNVDGGSTSAVTR